MLPFPPMNASYFVSSLRVPSIASLCNGTGIFDSPLHPPGPEFRYKPSPPIKTFDLDNDHNLRHHC